MVTDRASPSKTGFLFTVSGARQRKSREGKSFVLGFLASLTLKHNNEVELTQFPSFPTSFIVFLDSKCDLKLKSKIIIVATLLRIGASALPLCIHWVNRPQHIHAQFSLGLLTHYEYPHPRWRPPDKEIQNLFSY